MTAIILALAFIVMAIGGYFVMAKLDRFINHSAKVTVPERQGGSSRYSDVRIIYMEDEEDK